MKAQAISEGMITMRRAGMLKVQQGVTTPHEVIRNVFSIAYIERWRHIRVFPLANIRSKETCRSTEER